MAQGVKPLRMIKLGRETTPGTAVAATTQYRGLGTMQDARIVNFTQEDIGIIGGVDRTNIPYVVATMSFEPVVATFEQFPHMLEAGIKSVGSGTTEGSGFIYTYPLATNAVPTTKTYTVEGGDNAQAEEMEYAFVKSFVLSGAQQAQMMMSAEWTARQATNTTFTDSTNAPLPTVEDALFQKSKLYVDDVTTNAGVTLISNTMLGAEISVNTGLMEVFAGDGNLYFSFTKITVPEVLGRFTFEHNATSVTEKTNWRAQTARLLRFQVNGSNLTTAGSSFSTKAIRVDMAGKWESFEKIGEQNGNDIIRAVFRSRYNASAAQHATFVVCNNLSAVP